MWRRGITGPRMAIDLHDIIGRDEARALGLKHFFTGKPCKRGHVAERDVSSRECVECYRQRRREWRAANLEKAKEKERKHARKYRAAVAVPGQAVEDEPVVTGSITEPSSTTPVSMLDGKNGDEDF